MRPLLRGETVTFAGRFYEVREAALLPAPDRPIPILVAGNGPRLLRLAARYADAWNTAWFGLPDDRLRRRLDAFEAALSAEGCSPDSIRRTVGVEVADPDSVAANAEMLDAYRALGIDEVILGLRPPTVRSLDGLAAALRAA